MLLRAVEHRFAPDLSQTGHREPTFFVQSKSGSNFVSFGLAQVLLFGAQTAPS